MKRLIIVLGLLFVVTSCKTSFRISVQEPAVVDIPTETKAFAIVNNVTRANSPEQAVGTVISGGSINGNVVAGERAVDGILRALDNSNNLSAVIYQSNQLRTPEGVINWVLMDMDNYICSLYWNIGLDFFIYDGIHMGTI